MPKACLDSRDVTQSRGVANGYQGVVYIPLDCDACKRAVSVVSTP